MPFSKQFSKQKKKCKKHSHMCVECEREKLAMSGGCRVSQLSAGMQTQ